MVTAARRAQPGAMTTFGLHLTSYPGPDAGVSIAAYTREVAAAVEDSGVFSTLWLTDHVQNPNPAASGGSGAGIASRAGRGRGQHPAD